MRHPISLQSKVNETARNAVAIVAAAGSSTRMGGGRSKALSMVGAKTALERVVEAFQLSGSVSHVVITSREADEAEFLALPFRPGFVSVVRGGDTRQASVLAALSFIEARLDGNPDMIVAVHDAARCLVSADLIRRCVRSAAECGAVTAAVPCHDTITRSQGGDVGEVIDRDGVVLIQTPQVFRFDLLLRAHRESRGGATDDGSLVRAFHPVRVEPGERTNFKVTTPEDLELARAIVTMERGRSS